MSEENLQSLFNNLSLESKSNRHRMDPAQLRGIVEAAVSAALCAQQNIVDQRLAEVMRAIEESKPKPKAVETFTDVTINRSIPCDDGLDVVKSIPEFSGNKKEYLTFRRAAEVAYKVFECAEGSVKHYQALAIIRNKIKGSASDKLTGFGTALNFRAIMARLDHEYGDKRPIHLLEQELSTLRQGSLSVADYYDLVQTKLTALTNKTLMSYSDSYFAGQLNEKYRNDALRVFISGLKRSLSDTLFSSRPDDLPSALALAEELESNRERYNFAASFVKQEGDLKDLQIKRAGKPEVNKSLPRANNPNYSLPQPQVTRPETTRPEPMDVDPSLRAQLSRRSGLKSSGKMNQGINNITVETNAEIEGSYAVAANEALDDQGEFDLEVEDDIHFLGVSPCYRISKGQ